MSDGCNCRLPPLGDKQHSPNHLRDHFKVGKRWGKGRKGEEKEPKKTPHRKSISGCGLDHLYGGSDECQINATNIDSY